MPKTKPPYPAAFKQQIVELVMVGRTPASLRVSLTSARRASLHGWRALRPTPASLYAARTCLSSAEREELARLRRRVRQLEQERDILAKATAWFAGKDGKTSSGSTNS